MAKTNRTNGLSFTDIKETYEWPVIIEIPQGVDGKGNALFKEVKVFGEFNLLPQDEIDEIQKRGEEQTEFSFIYDKVVNGWREVYLDDAKTQVMEVTDENKDKLKQVSYIMNAFVNAYLRSQGGKKAQIKN